MTTGRMAMMRSIAISEIKEKKRKKSNDISEQLDRGLQGWAVSIGATNALKRLDFFICAYFQLVLETFVSLLFF